MKLTQLFRRIGPLRMQAVKITALGGLFWFAWAFACYQSVYLQEVGFSASELGVLNAVSAAVAIVSISFWGMVSDRIGSLKKVLFLILIAGSALYALIPLIPTGLPQSSLLFLVLLPFVNFFRASFSPLVENMQVRNCNELRLNYGTIRAAGSLLFTIGSFIVTALLARIHVANSFWLSFILFLPVIALCLFVRNPHGKRRGASGREAAAEQAPGADTRPKKEKMDLRPLFRNRQYVIFLGFGLMFYFANSCEGGFMPYYMASIGVPPERYGLILGTRALCEIPFLILMARLRRRFTLPQLLMMGVVLMSLECLGFGLLVGSLPGMLLCAIFFGLGNGLFIGSSMNYLYQLAPMELKASAQAFFTAVASVAGIAGNLAGGLLFDRMGAHPFYLLVAGAYLLSVCILLAAQFLSRQRTAPDAAEPQN